MNPTIIPLFSVIIPTYQRNDLLAKCLDCLAPNVQTLSTESYEVIVTDDGFNTTAEGLIRERYPWAKWVSGSRKGPAANRNNGAKYAKGKWLVFTDDDCLPDRHWLEAYAKAIVDESNYQVFEGRTYVNRPKKSLSEVSPINETGGYLWSCNFAIERRLFESIDGFDERFPYAAMEDVDLNYRLTKEGYKSFFVNSASVCHPWRKMGEWQKLKQHQKSTLIYLSIHPEESNRLNKVYYLRAFLKDLILEIIPGILKYRGAGATFALLKLWLFLENMLLVKPPLDRKLEF